MSTSTPPEPRSYDPASGTPRPAERTSILGRTGSSEPVDSEATQALPADWAAGQPATSVMPAGADGSAGEQPATSVMPAGAGEWFSPSLRRCRGEADPAGGARWPLRSGPF